VIVGETINKANDEAHPLLLLMAQTILERDRNSYQVPSMISILSWECIIILFNVINRCIQIILSDNASPESYSFFKLNLFIDKHP